MFLKSSSFHFFKIKNWNSFSIVHFVRFCDQENLHFKKKNLWTSENEFMKKNWNWILKTVYGKHSLKFLIFQIMLNSKNLFYCRINFKGFSFQESQSDCRSIGYKNEISFSVKAEWSWPKKYKIE